MTEMPAAVWIGLASVPALSASLATRILVPSGVKVSWSGPTPTARSVRSVPAASNSATRPGWSPATLA